MAGGSISQEILSHLLLKLGDPHSRHHQRYSSLVTPETQGTLRSLLNTCMRPQFIQIVDDAELSSLTDYKRLPWPLDYRGRAIYLHIIHDAEGNIRYYVGQAFNYWHRINKQHRDFRYRRDHLNLHAWAMNSSTVDYFVVLGTLTVSHEQPDLVMNLLEMWATAIFQSLVPRASNQEWLPSSIKPNNLLGLNVGLPLDTGLPEDEVVVQAQASFDRLVHAEDEVARKYYLYKANRIAFRQGSRQAWLQREGMTTGGQAGEAADVAVAATQSGSKAIGNRRKVAPPVQNGNRHANHRPNPQTDFPDMPIWAKILVVGAALWIASVLGSANATSRRSGR